MSSPEAVVRFQFSVFRQLARQRPHDTGQQPHLRCITGALRIGVELRRQRRQRTPTLGAAQSLGTRELLHDRRRPVARQTVAAHELVDVCPRDREMRRPDELWLLLRIEMVEVHQLGGVDLVLRQQRIRLELENVEATRDLELTM